MSFLLFRHNRLHFCHVDHRQVTNKQTKQEEKQTNWPDKRAHINDWWCKISPRRGQKRAAECGDNQDKTLQPHTKVNQNCSNKKPNNICTPFFKPKCLRNENITNNHPPISPSIWTIDTIPVPKFFIRICAIKNREKFDNVDIRHDNACKQNKFCTDFYMPVCNQIMKFEYWTHHNQQIQAQTKSWKNCPSNKIRRKKRRMPTRQNWCGKV